MVSSTEVGPPIVDTSGPGNAATGRASIACASSHGASQISLRGEETDRPRARGKTIELMVYDRAAIPERASLRRSAKSSPKAGNGFIGSRSSAESASLDQTTHLPEERLAIWQVQPWLDLRRGQVRGYQDAAHPWSRHSAARVAARGGFEASDAGCRLRVGVRMDPSGLSESALPPRRQHRLSQTGLTYRKQAASSARLIWSVWSGQGTWVGAAPPCRSLVEPAYPKAGPELSLPKLKGFLIRRPDGFSSSPPLGAQGVRCRTARETYRLSCQRSLSHLTLMGFRPLQRLGQRKRPTPDSPSGCATLSGFLNLSAFYSSP
jgi:hypothetical protein